MGRAEYFDPVSQSRKPIKSGSIVNNAGLEYTPEDVKEIDDKIGILRTDHESHEAEIASLDNVHGLRGDVITLGTNSSILRARSIAIGVNATSLSDSSLGNSVAIGYGAETQKHDSVAVGDGAITGSSERTTAIGSKANADRQGIALGYYAISTGFRSVAIGTNVSSENDYTAILGQKDGGIGANKWIVPGTFTVNGTKNFEIPHPKPEKSATHRIRHGAVESPSAGDTLYRYRVISVKENDLQIINLPDYFIHLNKDVQMFVTPQGHFGNGYGELNRETEQLEIHCKNEGEYNVLVIGTRNDNHQSVQDWDIKGVEREIGESWNGETYAFSVDEIIEVEEIKEEEF